MRKKIIICLLLITTVFAITSLITREDMSKEEKELLSKSLPQAGITTYLNDCDIEKLEKELMCIPNLQENETTNCYLPDTETEICTEEKNYKEHNIVSNGFKSYMDYRTITNKSSEQYKLKEFAYIGNYGIYQINNRYLIAVGTGVGAEIGTYVDLFLENGTYIPCVVGDIKDDRHTLKDNITTARNGCVSEFIVDKNILTKSVKAMGDMSYCEEGWDSPVVTIKVYNKNFFDMED